MTQITLQTLPKLKLGKYTQIPELSQLTALLLSIILIISLNKTFSASLLSKSFFTKENHKSEPNSSIIFIDKTLGIKISK